jgi:HPt (histidine-containing phosphotransfer) domain-containing protein
VDENIGNGDEVVDWIVFCAARSELGAGFARILSYFREDGEKAVSRIEAAMQSRDTAGLVLPAHTMKSEARQFGAEPLGALAEEIEFTARRAIEIRAFPDELIPAVARLRPLYLETMTQLEAEANPLVKRRAAGT